VAPRNARIVLNTEEFNVYSIDIDLYRRLFELHGKKIQKSSSNPLYVQTLELDKERKGKERRNELKPRGNHLHSKVQLNSPTISIPFPTFT
jgi:hypothetical protein